MEYSLHQATIMQPTHAPVARANPTRAQPDQGQPAADAVEAPARDILRLQRQVGNRAVAALIGGRRRVPAPASRAPNLVTIARSPATDAIAAIDNSAGPDIKGAFDKLTPLAMFDLLPALLTILQAGKLGTVEANASAMAGPRMVLAVKVVKLKQSAVKLTEPIIDGLIDDMETFPPDQRSDMLRFLGLTASITVNGFEVTFAYTKGSTGPSCEQDLLDAIAWSKRMQAEYTKAGAKKGMKTGTDIENAVHGSLAAQGVSTSVAGSTSSSGAVTIAATTMTKSQPILTRGTEIHEAEHAAHTLALQKKHGGKTAAFQKVWDSADDWWRDEVRAYSTEIPFYQKVVAAIKKLEKLKSP
jgi:hypothetical protein